MRASTHFVQRTPPAIFVAVGSFVMAPLYSSLRLSWLRRLVAIVVLLVVATSCSDTADDSNDNADDVASELTAPPRRYNAEWLIDPQAVGVEDPGFPYLYREVVDDQNGRYLVQSHNHLAVQHPEDVVFCAAITRVPLDPYCASTPRAEGAPHVLSYPVQLLREWGPRPLYDLANYREISLVADSDTENWVRRGGLVNNNIAVECFLVTGETTAALVGFEICFTDDDLHLVASVDLQNDLIFEIDLVNYSRGDVSDEFETGFEDFVEPRPGLQEQLLNLYPEIPAPRPTPTPDFSSDDG